MVHALERTQAAAVSRLMALGLALLPVNASAAMQATLPHEEIAPDLYLIESTAGSNVVALRGDENTLLVDAGPADGVERIQATLDSLGFPPVTHVIITHYHDDHLAGAAWFKQRGATVLAHSGTAVEAVRDTVIGDWNDWHREAAKPEAMPDIVFDDGVTVRVGENVVRVRHAPAAHTRGDAIVVFENLGVIHTGDIYEVGAYPFIDHWAGGTIHGLLRAVGDLLDNSREPLYVPGHGAPGGRLELTQYRDMLITVCRAVKSRVEAGDDVRAAIATRPTALYDDTSWGAPRHGRELAALMYWSLEAAGDSATCGANE